LDSTGTVNKDSDSEYQGKMAHKKGKKMKFQVLKSLMWGWMLLRETDLVERIPDSVTLNIKMSATTKP